jgi:hypothetical protein
MNKSDLRLNLYKLKGPLAKNGYDKWRHQFTGYNQKTGTAKTFFVEYFVCNPAIGNGHPILGQLPINQAIGRRPSYAMVKAGVWGNEAKQLHNFYAFSDFKCASDALNITIGNCELSEVHIKGHCNVSEKDAVDHEEYLSDAGLMTWDLQINKKIAYHVGRVNSKLYNWLYDLDHFWHAQGVYSEYSGNVVLDGIKYVVIPESSFGYADKNWGSRFSSPWMALNGCQLKRISTGKVIDKGAFVFKGGKFGKGLNEQLCGGLFYEGNMHHYHNKNATDQDQFSFEFEEGDTSNTWRVTVENRKTHLKLVVTCPIDEMLLLNYEAPDGMKNYNALWSGGTGIGTLELYKKTRKGNELIDAFELQRVGCEYGKVN